jgi:hypothetical protein
VLLKPFHELERHLTPALSPNKLAERESTVAVTAGAPVSKPALRERSRKSHLGFVGVESRLGSRRSVRVVLLKPFHELERHLSPALSPNKLAERESTVAGNS